MPFPKTYSRYAFTQHAQHKMRYYRLSTSRIQRIIRRPTRIEQGIVPGTVAVMAPAETKNYTEIWVMYKPVRNHSQQLRIITAWRYPGKSPERDPIPPEVLEEVQRISRTI